MLKSEQIILLKLDAVLSKNEVDRSLYSVFFRENNRICLFEKYGSWFSAFIFENKEHNLKSYFCFEDACIDFISILSRASRNNKEQEINILLDLKEELIKYSAPTLRRPCSK